MKKIICSLILLASLASCSCSKCPDKDCVCKPNCKVVEKHCGCHETCGCRF